MRCHANLGRRKIEGDLNYYDQYDVSQTLFGLRRMTMSHQKSCPRAHNSHDTTRRANELRDLYETDYHQAHNTRARGKP
jgi:hypothetical protein